MDESKYYRPKDVLEAVSRRRGHGTTLGLRRFSGWVSSKLVPGAKKIGREWLIEREVWDAHVAANDWDWIRTAAFEFSEAERAAKARRLKGDYENPKMIRKDAVPRKKFTPAAFILRATRVSTLRPVRVNVVRDAESHLLYQRLRCDLQSMPANIRRLRTSFMTRCGPTTCAASHEHRFVLMVRR